MSLTTDPKDPELGRGVDKTPVEQNKKYLVLSEEERKKGFVRPVHRSYVHVGIAGPEYPLRDLSPEQITAFGHAGYVKFEVYPMGSHGSSTGRFWTQKDLDRVNKGCGVETTMGHALCETYARQPSFYGSTYCCGCRMHLPVGKDGEFVWTNTTDRVGT